VIPRSSSPRPIPVPASAAQIIIMMTAPASHLYCS